MRRRSRAIENPGEKVLIAEGSPVDCVDEKLNISLKREQEKAEQENLRNLLPHQEN